ncbi:MAG: polyprenol monophosphomannose synthase [Chloroflexi bacterium]|nr:MAG: polyprenol monophosphomannose synthase [Chloroflexota bacterium]
MVPTYNEAGSLPDGSPDGTAQVADRLGQTNSVRVVRRPGKAGLASAVVAGFGAARGDALLVMDADLSHPPEVVPDLMRTLEDGADLAVGSRYVAGGGIEDWPLKRRVVSRVACLMGNVLVPIRDSTSGFFAMRRSVVDGVKLNPIGFKIGFEVMARGRYKKAVEVPYTFRDRELGKSKFGQREIGQYLIQLGQVARDRVLGVIRN